MASLHISINAEPIFTLGSLVITNSILTTWIVMGIVIALVFAVKNKMSYDKPGRLQTMFEFLVESLYGVVIAIAGDAKAKKFFPLIAAFFFFILFSNWFGLLPGVGTIGIPGSASFVPLLRAPTADVNTTLALGLISMIMVQVYGFSYQGFGYLRKFFDLSNPIKFFVGLLELLSDFSKVISFTFRLFGNIFAGEVLLVVMAMLIPLFGPIPFLGLEIFVGLIQAFVFLMLSAVFMNMATIGHGDDHDKSH